VAGDGLSIHTVPRLKIQAYRAYQQHFLRQQIQIVPELFQASGIRRIGEAAYVCE